jgi:hypothetical protein
LNGSSHRRKIVALVLSGIFPGLGQFYNRAPLKGVAFVVASGVLFWLADRAMPTDLQVEKLLLAPDQAQNLFGVALILPLCLILIVWLWSLIDAWRGADRSGFL